MTGRWRAMTDAELEDLQGACSERRSLVLEQRNEYPTPEAANASIAGAIYWAIRTSWQDRPFVLAGGIGLIVWQIFMLLVGKHIF